MRPVHIPKVLTRASRCTIAGGALGAFSVGAWVQTASFLGRSSGEAGSGRHRPAEVDGRHQLPALSPLPLRMHERLPLSAAHQRCLIDQTGKGIHLTVGRYAIPEPVPPERCGQTLCCNGGRLQPGDRSAGLQVTSRVRWPVRLADRAVHPIGEEAAPGGDAIVDDAEHLGRRTAISQRVGVGRRDVDGQAGS